jgi:hypothetical protein
MRQPPKRQLEEWAWARIELGLTTEEYLDLTSLEFAALVEAWNAKQSNRVRETASLYAFLTNLLYPKARSTAADYLPKPKKSYRNEKERAAAIMAQFRAAFPQQPRK